MTFDQAGNLYGETLGGACPQGGGTACGTIFELSPSAGSWTETIIHRFGTGLTAKGGSAPGSGMIWDKDEGAFTACAVSVGLGVGAWFGS